MAFSRAICCAVALIAVAIPLSWSCIVPPESCTAPKCASLPAFYPGPSWNYSDARTWLNPQLRGVAFYRGVFNRQYGRWAPTANTPETWQALRDNGLVLNLEKFPIEQEFVIGTPFRSSIHACCDFCRTQQGCALYLWQPTTIQLNFAIWKSDSGTCYPLRGGVYKNDGPFDPITNFNYGTPNSGTNSWQADSNRLNQNKMGYVGGFCNPNPNVIDDPHFTGAHGTRFEFNGELDRTYCLLTDQSLHVNIKLKGYKDERTVGATVGEDGKAIRSWIEEVGFVWKDEAGSSHTFHMVARPGKEQNRGETGFIRNATIDGQPVVIPQEKDEALQSGDLTFTFLGTTKKGIFDVDNFFLVLGTQLKMKISLRVAHPLLQTETHAHAHFNLMFSSFSPSEKVHGVLGQTYRNTASQIIKSVEYSMLNKLLGTPIQADGRSGQGFLEGSASDYVSSDVRTPDCRVSAYT